MRGRNAIIWLASLSIATLVVLADTGQNAVGNSMHDSNPPPFFRLLLWPSIWWYSWAIFGVGVYYLTRRFPLTREYRSTSLWIHLVGCVATYLGHVSVQVAAMALPVYQTLHPTWSHAILHHAGTSIFLNLLMYWSVVAASHAFIFYSQYREREVHAAKLKADLHKAQLSSLKMQLQPHFLFNTLNAVSTLMYRDVSAADQMIGKLGDLLRKTIDQSNVSEITLKEELDFITNYLDIEQARFGDRLTVTFDIAPKAYDAAIPYLILQPLVENAIKHGISNISSPGHIHIQATIQSNVLILAVSDNGPGLEGDSLPGSGTGISNTRQRLEKIYGERFSLSFIPNTPEGLIVRLKIPFQLLMPQNRRTEIAFA